MIVNLNNLGLIKVIGADARSFLQNQLSNDIELITKNNTQLSAYLTPQGRIIALFRIFKINDGYLLELAKDLVKKVLKRLQIYVMMSKVELIDATNEYVKLGFIGYKNSAELKALIKKNNLMLYNIDNKRKMLIYKNNGDLDKYLATASKNEVWQQENINNFISEVNLATSELFLPQMLNLDLDANPGVSFKKGCYPGQEVVARLNYLGSAKQRLIKLKSKNKIKAGDKLSITKSTSLKDAGIIVSVVKIGGDFLALASIETKFINSDDEIKLKNSNTILIREK